MNELMGWATLVIVLAAGPTLTFIGLRHALSRKPVEEKYRGGSGGMVGVFDAVWSPSAQEANEERDRQQRASVPAPTPDRGPGRLDDTGHIVIDID